MRLFRDGDFETYVHLVLVGLMVLILAGICFVGMYALIWSLSGGVK